MGQSKKKTGLGRALMKQRFQTNPNFKINSDGMVKNSHEMDKDYEQAVNMKSITEENDLDAFLASAELAGTDFTAERLNVTVVSVGAGDPKNPFLLSKSEEKEALRQHDLYKEALTIPRRPEWNQDTTANELQKMERESFLDWRRGLVFLEEEKGLILTPYERNIEVWRQLWRVIERSELVVQIVDGRNPLFFHSADLQKYVLEVNSEKINLLLVNKADMLTVSQRMAWADYFESHGIAYTFFSAAMARETLEQEDGNVSKEREFEVEDDENVPEKARIVGALELVELIQSMCPHSEYSMAHGKRTIGFVGYPNVGKSSTLNALVGATKVAVGSTPGKTKHFQTIHLSDSIILCDCPGLVFPSFATTKADMVVNGVLPIDQLREHVGPSGLIAQRIPKYYLEAIYGINIKTRNLEGELEYRAPTAEEFLSAYAVARGYTKSSQGNPDEARAARVILKDYVNGKLLYVSPPPGLKIDADAFNLEIYQDERLLARQIKKLNLALIQEKIAQSTIESRHKDHHPLTNANTVDKDFFHKREIKAKTNGNSRTSSADFKRVTSFPYQEGSEYTLPAGKKAHKKDRRRKVRDNWTKID